mgnify:CR=1 FL=1
MAYETLAIEATADGLTVNGAEFKSELVASNKPAPKANKKDAAPKK